MTRSKEAVCTLLSLLALFVLAAPAAAQPPILPGVDLFSTGGTAQNPTFVDFSSNPIPADFFCQGSAPFTGAVALKGVPLSTTPAGVTGGADTIVERLTQGNFVGGIANMTVIVRALQLTSVFNLQVTCGDNSVTEWRVDSCLCGTQPKTDIQAKVDQSCGCGHFSGLLSLNVCLHFTEIHTGQTLGPIKQTIKLSINNMPWCPRPGTGETIVDQRFKVASKCDGEPDFELPGTTNFHPGWTCASQAQAAAAGNCWSMFASLTHCHSSFGQAPHDHCINPICGRPPG